jgi:streptogramin lyase
MVAIVQIRRPLALLAMAALLAAAALSAATSIRGVPNARAAFGDITEYTPPGIRGIGDSMPVDIITGPDNNLWFTERNGRAIGRITPGGVITEFLLPTPDAIPDGIAVGPDGWIYFCESQATGSRIGRLNPLAPDPGSTIQELPVLDPPNAGPTYITRGPDGNLWFTERRASRIGRLNPTTLELTEFQVSLGNPRLIHIISALGALWFTEQFDNKIGRITTTGEITEWVVPTASSDPSYLALGPDGNIWFSEYGCTSTAGTAFTTCNPTSTPEPGNLIANLNPTIGVFTEFATIPTTNSKPCGLLFDGAGRVWFTEQAGNMIASMDSTTGAITEYPVPSPSSLPTAITVGPDGSYWFTEFFGEDEAGRGLGGKIARFDTTLPLAPDRLTLLTKGRAAH